MFLQRLDPIMRLGRHHPSDTVLELIAGLQGQGLVGFLEPPVNLKGYLDGGVLGFYQPETALVIAIAAQAQADPESISSVPIMVYFSHDLGAEYYEYTELAKLIGDRTPFMAVNSPADYYDARPGAEPQPIARSLTLLLPAGITLSLDEYIAAIAGLRDLLLIALPIDRFFPVFDARMLAMGYGADIGFPERFFGQEYVVTQLAGLQPIVAGGVYVSSDGLSPYLNIWTAA